MSNNTGTVVFPAPPQDFSYWFTFNSSSDKSSSINTNYTRFYIISIVALSLVIALVLLLHLYLRYVRRRHLPQHRRRRDLFALSSFTATPRYELPGGLDLAEIASIRSFQYCNKSSGNTEESNNKYDKEDCVICLSFLEEGDVVRMLPACRHVFHVGCIDKWLVASASCPVCRADVHPEEQSLSVDQVNDVETGELAEPKDVEAESSVSSRLSLSFRRMLSRGRSSRRVHGNEDGGLVGDLERGIDVNTS